jgi:hypothetical protein
MEDLLEGLMRDNVAEVKVVLASVALALAVYQLVLIAVGYGKVRPPFLGARPASTAHRSVGVAIVAVTIAIVTAKLGTGGGRDDDDDRGGDRTEQVDGGSGRGRGRGGDD